MKISIRSDARNAFAVGLCIAGTTLGGRWRRTTARQIPRLNSPAPAPNKPQSRKEQT